MKVNSVEKTNEEFVKNQKGKLHDFLKLCKYDVVPSILAGSAVSTLLVPVQNSAGAVDVMLFGGVAGAAFILAANGTITGIKATKKEKEEIKENLESKGKTK